MGVIDEIKDKLDIVDVVSEYATLQKSGRNFKALCPFHTEKTPSFFVFPERQSWHCFGSCGIGGDIFSFIMKKEGLDFGETLKLLAERAGVKLPSRQRGQARDDEWERLYSVNAAAAQYYHHLLLDDKQAELARKYLGQRGISSETIESFELGYSPNSWDALYKHMTSKGHKSADLVNAGVTSAKENGGFHDQFRNRLMIPIRNETGRVVGFGARTLDGSNPKYLNSPQTAIFDKGGLLYGLDHAKESIRERNLAIIVEGYIDVLTAHQHSFTNVVAPMGTSLTDRQMNILKRLTRNISLALDADAAGEQATLREIEEVRKTLSERIDRRTKSWLEGDSRLQGDLKIIPIPQGQDPDDVIRKNPDEWTKLVDEALPVMDYFFNATATKFDLSKASEREAAADQILNIISEIKCGGIERDQYLKRLSKLVEVNEKTLIEKAAQLRPTASEKGKKAIPLPPTPISKHPLEEYCLSLLLQNPWLQDRGVALSPEHFEGTENRELFIAWMSTPNIDTIREELDPSLYEHFNYLTTKVLPPSSERELEIALADCTRRLWEQRLRKIKTMEETLLSEAESEGDINSIRDKVETLLKKSLEPTAQLKELFEKARRERRGARK
jgi:DNA primase